MGKVFQNDLEEYGLAINAYEAYLQQFPNSNGEPDALLGLYYCYSKLGNTARANFYKNKLTPIFIKINLLQTMPLPTRVNW